MAEIEYSGRDNLDVMLMAKNYNAYLVDLISTPARQDSTIIDFGAGSGTFATPLRALGYDVRCVETDPVLKAGLEKAGFQVNDDLDRVEDGSVDYLYSLNVLEHIPDDDFLLRLWFKKLKSGGEVLVYVPAFPVLFSSMDTKVGHHRRYTIKDLQRKLEAAGFSIGRSRYADCVGFFATLAYKLMGDKDGGINPTALRIYDKFIFPLSRLLDTLAGSFFGKNVYVRARKPR